MKNTLHIDALMLPTGPLTLHFQYFMDDGPPHAWLDLHSDSDDAAHGGVAINCLDIGDIPALHGIFGKTFSIAADENSQGGELTESVVWAPGDQTLEISSLQLTFGHPGDQLLPVELAAVCFDHQGRSGIRVLLSGTVLLAAGKPAP